MRRIERKNSYVLNELKSKTKRSSKTTQTTLRGTENRSHDLQRPEWTGYKIGVNNSIRLVIKKTGLSQICRHSIKIKRYEISCYTRSENHLKFKNFSM